MDCPICAGKGLVGNGDKPWLLEGVVKTCSACAGRGTVEPVTLTEDITHVITQEDIDMNPGSDEVIKVGDEIVIEASVPAEDSEVVPSETTEV